MEINECRFDDNRIQNDDYEDLDPLTKQILITLEYQKLELINILTMIDETAEKAVKSLGDKDTKRLAKK